jgi:hypothetical protein
MQTLVVEQHMFSILDAARRREAGIVPRFRIQPRYNWVSGSSMKSYRSREYRLKEGLRTVTRSVAPWLWL